MNRRVIRGANKSYRQTSFRHRNVHHHQLMAVLRRMTANKGTVRGRGTIPTTTTQGPPLRNKAYFRDLSIFRVSNVSMLPPIMRPHHLRLPLVDEHSPFRQSPQVSLISISRESRLHRGEPLLHPPCALSYGSAACPVQLIIRTALQIWSSSSRAKEMLRNELRCHP